MRVLVTSFPALGHFHPVAPLALAAHAAGHDVRVASGPDLVDWIERCGLEAHGVGLTQAEARDVAAERYPEAVASDHKFTDVWVSAALPGLTALTDEWRPDVVIHEEEEYAAVLLAERVGAFAVTHSWASPARPHELRRLAAELLAPVWAEEAPGREVRTVGDLYLDACPPQFQTDAIDAVGDNVVSVRPLLFDGPPAEPPDWLSDLPRPAAYLTLGTVPVFSTPALLRTIVDGLQPEVAAVIVTTGPLGDLPLSVHAVEYLPQSLVLPHVDLMVSQAGAGGSVGALVYGLPHLALPQAAQSQISVAARIEELGVGRRLLSDEQLPDAIGARARELLGGAAYAGRARELAAELERLPSPADVLQIVATQRGSRRNPPS